MLQSFLTPDLYSPRFGLLLNW